MPTVLRDGPFNFVFFSSDRTEPPHIHVKRDRQIVKYWLDPVSLANNHGFAEHELNQISGLWHNTSRHFLRRGMTTLVLEQDPIAIAVTLTPENLVIGLADGRSLIVPLAWYPRLLHGSVSERHNWQLLGDGYAIEWPDLDEYIGVEGLLAGRRSGESEGSFGRWLTSRGSRP